jgi:amino acid transporter
VRVVPPAGEWDWPDRLGPVGLWMMAVAASAPLVVLSGGVPTMYAATGLPGVPLTFVVLGLALVPITAAFTAASRHLGHAATSYALLSQGWGRVAGVAGGAVAVVSYAAIGCSLLGLFGYLLSGVLGGAWWLWALLAWAVTALLGGAPLTANVTAIGLGVIAQLVIVAVVVWTAVTHPAESAVRVVGFAPSDVLSQGLSGLGGLLAFGVAAFVGYESVASYVEEIRATAALRRASFAALAFLAGGYALAAWAVAVGYGPDRVVGVARDAGSGMPLSLLGSAAPVGVLALLVAIVMSMVSFHALVARYLFRLGLERVLPSRLGRVNRGSRAGAPTAASLTQSGLSLAVLAVTAVAGVDPYAGLFVPASTLAAVGVLALLTGSSGAAGRFFARGGGGHEGVMVRRVAPVAGVLLGGLVLAVVVANLDRLLNVGAGSMATWLLPGIVAGAAVAGAVWGWWLRGARPDVYAGIGQGQPVHAARLDPRLAELHL